MPLVSITSIDSNCSWGLWKIEESLDDLVRMCNLPCRCDDSWNEKRKKEWLATRILLQNVCQFAGISYSDVVKDDNGKPNLVPSNAHISISHSKLTCCVIIHKTQKVGIDIELSTEKLLRVKDKFLNEQECVEAGDNLDMLSAYWCVKEAIYKMYSEQKLNFKEEIRIQPFDFSGNEADCLCSIKTNQMVKTVLMKILRFGKYTIAFNY